MAKQPPEYEPLCDPVAQRDENDWRSFVEGLHSVVKGDEFLNVTFSVDGGKPMIVIDIGKQTVWVDPAVESTDAAKLFWNAVCSLVGKPPMFPHW